MSPDLKGLPRLSAGPRASGVLWAAGPGRTCFSRQTCTSHADCRCLGRSGCVTVPRGTAGSGASAQAARPKACPLSSLLIREPSASRPFAELRSRPFLACPLSRPPSIPIHYQLGLAAPSMARHRSFSHRPSLQPPSAHSARRPAPAGLAYAWGAASRRNRGIAICNTRMGKNYSYVSFCENFCFIAAVSNSNI